MSEREWGETQNLIILGDKVLSKLKTASREIQWRVRSLLLKYADETKEKPSSQQEVGGSGRFPKADRLNKSSGPQQP